MKKKIVALSLCAFIAISLVACGGDEEKTNVNDTTSNSEQNEQTSVKDVVDDSEQETTGTEEKSTPVKDFVEKYMVPNYELNTADVSGMYFGNENMKLDMSFSEIQNISTITAEKWVGMEAEKINKNEDVTVSNIEELKGLEFYEEDEVDLVITFTNDETYKFDVSIEEYELTKYIHPDTKDYVEDYGTAMEKQRIACGCGGLDVNIGNYISGIDSNISCEEQLKAVVDMWGAPTAINYSTTYDVATIYYVFERTNIIFDVWESKDGFVTRSCSVAWENGDAVVEECKKGYSGEYNEWLHQVKPEIIEDEPLNPDDYANTNLPEDIVVVCEGKQTTLLGNNAYAALGELGLDNMSSKDYIASHYFYTWENSIHPNRGIIFEDYSEGILNEVDVHFGFYRGMPQEYSIFGLTAYSTIEDIYEIFGYKKPSYGAAVNGRSNSESASIYYDEVVIGGHKIDISFHMDDEYLMSVSLKFLDDHSK